MVGIIKKYAPILILLLLFGAILFYGIPAMDILGSQGTKTKSYWVGTIVGNSKEELIVGRKGFILSFRPDAYSEQITVQGVIRKVGLSPAKVGDYYMYKVYIGTKDHWHEVLSDKVHESYIRIDSGKCKDKFYGGFYQEFNCKALSFSILGNPFNTDVIGLRVELWAQTKENAFNPFEPFKWRRLASDQAYLYCGKSTLKVQGTQNTFEIGETVRLRVTTSAGGRTVGETTDKTWILKLYKPDGTEYVGNGFPKYLPDWFDGIVEFKITPDMWNPHGSNTYHIKVYNTLLEKGTYDIDVIDVKAKAPSNVSIDTSCGFSASVNEPITVTLTAKVNPQTQLPISYFKVWIWYGTHTDLMPPAGSDRWIKREEMISSHQVDSTTYQGKFTFTPSQGDRWITIAAKAYDEENRASLAMKYYQLYVTSPSQPAPSDEEIINQGGGTGNYTGGSTEETLPDFGGKIGSHFESVGEGDLSAILLLIMGLMIVIFSIIIAFIAPVHPYLKILIMVVGLVVTLLLWYFL